MFCPRCATQNADDARFCRSCGTDISLVPQAVSGALAERMAAAEEDDRRGRHKRRRDRRDRPPSVERAFRGVFMGLAFVFVALAVRAWGPAGNVWWWVFFIPAAVNLAEGLSSFLRLSTEGKWRDPQQPYLPAQPAVPPRPRVSALPRRDAGEVVPPPSVTEATTRHLGLPVERDRGE